MAESSEPGVPGIDPPDDAPSSTPASIWLNGVMFALTVVSVFLMGHLEYGGGFAFAVPLLAILLAHEFGHYIAARLHGVPASLPYFIPMPFLSPFGTMGAVITMRERIRSRDAVFDIGASGPIAGMVVALPVMAWGLLHSPIAPNPLHYTQEGQSLLYALMKRAFAGPIPAGSDVQMHPTAAAGWVGFLITMINLLPWGQLDGGHIAFALLGDRQHRVARWVRASLPFLFAYNLIFFVWPVLRHERDMPYYVAVLNSLFWLTWFVVTGVMGRFFGADHPPFEPGPLSPARRWAAWACLALFIALFMPTPMAEY